MDMAFSNRRGRWELDGHELAGGSVVEVNVCDRWITARDKCANNRLRGCCLLLNGEGMRPHVNNDEAATAAGSGGKTQ
jgi:hypothetical protein